MAENDFLSRLQKNDVDGIGQRLDRSMSAWSTMNDGLFIRSDDGMPEESDDDLFWRSDNDTLEDDTNTADCTEHLTVPFRNGGAFMATPVSLDMPASIHNDNQGLREAETESNVATAPKREEIQVSRQESLQAQATSSAGVAPVDGFLINETEATDEFDSDQEKEKLKKINTAIVTMEAGPRLINNDLRRARYGLSERLAHLQKAEEIYDTHLSKIQTFAQGSPDKAAVADELTHA